MAYMTNPNILKKNAFPFIWIALLAFTALGCGVYSFTQSSLPPEVKTVSIQVFYDEVGSGPPNISQNFTEEIRDYFQQNTSLSLVDFNGDLQLEGSIVEYSITPLAARAGGSQSFQDADVSGQERLKITVNVAFVNLFDETKDFQRSFSFYRDYDPEREPVMSNEQAFVDEITEQIVIDIFNATVADW